MQTIEEYKNKILENQQELRSRILEMMAKQNITLSRLAVEAGASWPTIKKFLASEIIVRRETLDRLKEWIESYEE